MCRVVCVHRRRVPRRKQQSKEVRNIVDTSNVFAITEYVERYIYINGNIKKTEKRRERVIMTTWTKGENGQLL
jgi:hypothetical protein